MTPTPHTIESKSWQVGILPETGASIAFGRVRFRGTWLDVMRPTDPANYDNPSLCSSFIMLPWANRIGGGKFDFNGETIQLRGTPDNPTARHGDVRDRVWEVLEKDAAGIRLRFDSTQHENVNWPFAFTAEAVYRVDGDTFVLELSLTNTDSRPFPAGYGHHPYFVRPEGDNVPQVEIPCARYFPLNEASLAIDAPQPVTDALDFRTMRPLNDRAYDNVLTDRDIEQPVKIHYPAWDLTLNMRADSLFRHVLLFTPAGKPFFAVEPQTNVNDGVNLLAKDIPGHGVFVLEPGTTQAATVRITV